MSAQVKFLNTYYWPDYPERMRLENLQDYLSYCNQAYYREREGQPKEFVQALKNEVHKAARKRLEVIGDDTC